jgi:hypothetical protein
LQSSVFVLLADSLPLCLFPGELGCLLFLLFLEFAGFLALSLGLF